MTENEDKIIQFTNDQGIINKSFERLGQLLPFAEVKNMEDIDCMIKICNKAQEDETDPEERNLWKRREQNYRKYKKIIESIPNYTYNPYNNECVFRKDGKGIIRKV